MGIAYFYVGVFMGIVILVGIAVTLTIPFIIVIVKKKNKAKWILGALLAANLILALFSSLWLASHQSYPDVNDWHFIGHDIDEIEREYGDFERKKLNDDGSGYAVYMTEQIVGYPMYDSNEYSCYHMEFDPDGKITSVYCECPVGG